jgi:hypothetical protein
MKYLDYACAWTIFLSALVFIVIIGFWHPSGMFLDTPELWIPVAMMNFLRLRNGYSGVRGLRIFCIAANSLVLITEITRFGLFASRILRSWGSYYLVQSLKDWIPYFIVALCALIETVFSLHKSNSMESAPA